jgi:urease beta subunit
MIPGEIRPGSATELATTTGGADGEPPIPGGGVEEVTEEAADILWLEVVNEGDRPVQVGSHYHLFEVNPRLRLDRALAYGRRLAVPAGGSVRFEPGERRRVATVPFRGARRVQGFAGLVDGPLDDPEIRETALRRARERGFAGAE